eukprot:Gb_01621 [translate_table: standard]
MQVDTKKQEKVGDTESSKAALNKKKDNLENNTTKVDSSIGFENNIAAADRNSGELRSISCLDGDLKRSLFLLPRKRVVLASDPDMGSSVLSREDMVIIVDYKNQKKGLVQHADGTLIYNQVILTSNNDNGCSKIAPGQILHDTNIKKEVNHQCSGGKIQYNDEVDVSKQDDKRSMLRVPPSKEPMTEKNEECNTAPQPLRGDADNQAKIPPEGNLQGSLASIASASLPDPPGKTSLSSARMSSDEANITWKVEKDTFPTVIGKNGFVEVEFETISGKYLATWTGEGQIRLTTPDSCDISTDGTKVVLECLGDKNDSTTQQQSAEMSSGVEELNTWEKVNRCGSSINTNGHFVFDLVEGSLYCADKFGNGFIARNSSDVQILSANMITRSEDFSHHTDRRNDSTNTNAENFPATDAMLLGSNTKLLETGTQLLTNVVEANMHGLKGRLFIIHDGGQGYEFLDEKSFKKYAQKNKAAENSFQVTENFISDEKLILHSFVKMWKFDRGHSTHGPNSCSVFSDYFLKCSVVGLDAMHMPSKYSGLEWLESDSTDLSLPKFIGHPSECILKPSEQNVILYRLISEYPKLSDDNLSQISTVLEKCQKWQAENLRNRGMVSSYCDVRTKEQIEDASEVAAQIHEVNFGSIPECC